MADPRIPDLNNHACPACGSTTIDLCRTVTVVQTMPCRFDPTVGDWEDAGPDVLGDTIDSGLWQPTGTCAACGALVRIPDSPEPPPSSTTEAKEPPDDPMPRL